jgi:hypothetical protein
VHKPIRLIVKYPNSITALDLVNTILRDEVLYQYQTVLKRCGVFVDARCELVLVIVLLLRWHKLLFSLRIRIRDGPCVLFVE